MAKRICSNFKVTSTNWYLVLASVFIASADSLLFRLYTLYILSLVFPLFSIPCMHSRIYTDLCWCSLCTLYACYNFGIFHNEFSCENVVPLWRCFAPLKRWQNQQTEGNLNYGTNIAMHLYILTDTNTYAHTHTPSKGLKIEIHKQTKKKSRTENLFTLTSWEIRSTLPMSNDLEN